MSLNYTDNHTRSDLMTRFRDLDTERTELEEAIDDAETDEEKDEATDALNQWMDEYEDERNDLDAATDVCLDDSTLFIHESNLRTYVDECIDEAMPYGHSRSDWPYTCIDSEQAEEELTSDLSTIEICGETYYYQG